MTPFKLRKFDVVRGLPDVRDFRFAKISKPVPVPTKVDLRPMDMPIWDQGQMGSCTGNGWAALHDFCRIDVLMREQPHMAVDAIKKVVHGSSRLFIYGAERQMDGTFNQDSGAQIRDGGEVLNKLGVVPEAMWPYDEAHLYAKPPASIYAEALKHRNSTYYRLRSDSEIKSCLAQGYPVVFGFSVYSSFDSIGSNGIMPAPRGSVEGGHCVVIVGYDDARQVWIVRNSWGSAWADGGYFHMSYKDHNDIAFDHFTLRL